MAADPTVLLSTCSCQHRAALFSLVRDGNTKAAVKTLQDIFNTINTAEPRNAALYVKVGGACVRACGPTHLRVSSNSRAGDYAAVNTRV